MTELEMTEIADGVFVTMSSFAMTRSTVVADADGSCLLIDPGVTVAEMVALARLLDARGLRPVAGWSTHPHWDHVLWHRSLGIEAPRYAAPAAVEIAQTERDGMVDGVERAAPGHDLSLFGKLVALDADPPSRGELSPRTPLVCGPACPTPSARGASGAGRMSVPARLATYSHQINTLRSKYMRTRHVHKSPKSTFGQLGPASSGA